MVTSQNPNPGAVFDSEYSDFNFKKAKAKLKKITKSKVFKIAAVGAALGAGLVGAPILAAAGGGLLARKAIKKRQAKKAKKKTAARAAAAASASMETETTAAAPKFVNTMTTGNSNVFDQGQTGSSSAEPFISQDTPDTGASEEVEQEEEIPEEEQQEETAEQVETEDPGAEESESFTGVTTLTLPVQGVSSISIPVRVI